MLKQFLSKFPRKPSKSDSNDSIASNAGNSAAGTSANLIQRSSTAKRMSSAVFPAGNDAVVEPLQSLRDVANTEKPNLFIIKLNLCRTVYDFTDPMKNTTEKEIKRQTLTDLLEFVSSTNSKYPEPAISAMCKMFAANLFRTFPPNYQSGSGGESEEDDPVFDPAWSHLQIVYDILLRFVSSTSLDVKITKKYLDQPFILKLLDLFDSEDPRERECLKTILHRIYGKFMVHRPFIRKSVSNIFYRFVLETERHNGTAELLEIFGSVISGFALPLKEEHKFFLKKVLIPLHKPKSIGVYLQQLSYCLTQFIEKDPKLSSTVIRGLLKYWPVTNSQKEVMFLGEIEEVLEVTNVTEFQKIMVPLFRKIGQCLSSSHFQVAERALFLWNNDHIVSLMAPNRQIILSLIFSSLEGNLKKHWNKTVLNLTVNVRNLFMEMDEELFQTYQSKFEEEQTKLTTLKEKRRVMWDHLEAVAREIELGSDLTFNVTIASTN